MTADKQQDLRYKVEMKPTGLRSGWVFYVEDAGRLPLGYELLPGPGVGVYVRPLAEWDDYCDKHGAGWAKGRREEILERVARSVLQQRYGRGTFEITDHWVNVFAAPSLLSRLLGVF